VSSGLEFHSSLCQHQHLMEMPPGSAGPESLKPPPLLMRQPGMRSPLLLLQTVSPSHASFPSLLLTELDDRLP